ncbi:B12-binding domain-containing radical SAM protein [bacterium]|nr:B12-binding domain-containing radical SAM protein [bacterium]
MKKALIFYPPSGLFRREERCQSAVEDQTIKVIFPPLDLAYCASILENLGWQCKIIDFPAEGLNYHDLVSIIHDFHPDYLIAKLTVATFKGDMESLKFSRENLPNAKIIVFGGIDAQNKVHHLKILQYADIIIQSNPEDILQELGSGQNIEFVKGIIYKKNNSYIDTGSRNDKHELDEYPLPARHLLKNELYVNPENNKKITLIRTSQGCSHKCIFCPAYNLSSGIVRRRSPENIILEIKECIEKYGINDFHFDADTFTLNKAWTKDLCSRIAKEKLKISWYCNSRVDTVDIETLKIMKAAGCRVIGFGIESGNQKSLDRIKKKITLEQAESAVRLCHEAGIYSHTFFVIGLPWENEDMVHQTINFIKKLNPDFFDINIAYPIPGTELYDLCLTQNLFIDNGNAQSSYANSPVKTEFLSRNELIKLRKMGLRQLYLRPSYILKTLGKVIGNPQKTSRYFRYGLRRLRQLT